MNTHRPDATGALSVLPLGDILPLGWMRAQMRRDLQQGYAGCLDRLTPRAATDLFSQRIGATPEQQSWWDAETRGNWLWGTTMMAFMAGLPEHQARVSALLQALMATQDEDGYIGIYTPATRYAHGAAENGELWAQSRALLPLLALHEFTGRRACRRGPDAGAPCRWTPGLQPAGQGARHHRHDPRPVFHRRVAVAARFDGRCPLSRLCPADVRRLCAPALALPERRHGTCRAV
jgi:hypothetical protein